MNILIPLHGKMTARSLINDNSISALKDSGINPIILVPKDENKFSNQSLEIRRYTKSIFEVNSLSRLLILKRALIAPKNVSMWRHKIFAYDNVVPFPNTIMQIIKYLLFSITPKSFLFHHIALQTEKIYCSIRHNFNDILHDIDIILSPGIGSFGYEKFNPLILYALKHKLPVVSYIPNYDNLSIRGLKGFTPDVVCVWGPKMVCDAGEMQKIPKNRISIIGPILYDSYFHHLNYIKSNFSRQQLLQKYGLEPKKKTILFAFGENNLGNMVLSLNLLRHFPDANVIIRTHPSPRLSSTSLLDSLQYIQNLSNTLLYISNASNNNDLSIKYHTADINELVELIEIADVTISHYSTITLESCILDTPAVEIDYDSFAPNPRRAGLSRLPHNSDILRRKAVFTIDNLSDIKQVIREILSGAKISKENINTYVANECGTIDGKAINRLCKVLSDQIK